MKMFTNRLHANNSLQDRIKKKLPSDRKLHTVELHLTELNGKASNPEMQETRIIGFFFENRLH